MKDNSQGVPLDKLVELQKSFHGVRLGIMAALFASGTLTFQELKRELKVTDGNLSVHLKFLEKQDYIKVQKLFVGRKPQTRYSLIPTGKEAFKDYISLLEKLVKDIQPD